MMLILQELALGPCQAVCDEGAALLAQHSGLRSLVLYHKKLTEQLPPWTPPYTPKPFTAGLSSLPRHPSKDGVQCDGGMRLIADLHLYGWGHNRWQALHTTLLRLQRPLPSIFASEHWSRGMFPQQKYPYRYETPVLIVKVVLSKRCC